tara:strand:+ start:103 stop:453 length:351 start_codon:yes stop_codon:yes gene_type:complete
MIGIYDSESGLLGEISYLFKKFFRGQKCGLCELTHGWNPLGKSSWKKACQVQNIGIELIHRNEASKSQLQAAGKLPAIIFKSSEGWQCAATCEDLKERKGDPKRVTELVSSRLNKF